MALPVLAAMPTTSRSTASDETTASGVAISRTAPSDGPGFTDAVGGALRSLAALQADLDRSGPGGSPETGDLTALGGHWAASSTGPVRTPLTVANRDRAVAAFTDITRMQV